MRLSEEPTTTTVSTTHHLALFVRTDDGRELQERFVDLPLAVRSGNRVAIVYGGDTRSRLGVAVAVVNMDTHDVAVDTRQAQGIASRLSLLKAACWGLAVAAAGAAVAGRHVYVLYNPSVSCGLDPVEDFVNSLPPAQWLPQAFFADGACGAKLPPLFGLDIPEWSLVWLVALALTAVLLSWRRH